MSIPTDVQLVARIEKLESTSRRLARQNRWFKAIALVAVMVGLSGILMGQNDEPTESISAQKFIVKTKEGKSVGMFTGSTGAPILGLIDNNGKLRGLFSLSKTSGSPTFAMLADGKTRFSCSLSSSGAPVMMFKNPDGSERISIATTNNDETMISMKDGAGNQRLQLIAAPDGTAAVTLSGADGKTRSMNFVSKDGIGGLTIKNNDGETIHRAPGND